MQDKLTLHFINLYDYIEKNPIAQLTLHSWKTLMPELKIKIWTEKDEFIQKLLNGKNKLIDTWDKGKEDIYKHKEDIDLGNICDYLRLNIQYEFGGWYAELDQVLLEPFEINEDLEYCEAINVNEYKTISSSDSPCYFKKYNPIVYSVIQDIENNFNIKEFLKSNEFSFCEVREKSLISNIIKLGNNSSLFRINFIHFVDFFCEKRIIFYNDLLPKEIDISNSYLFTFNDRFKTPYILNNIMYIPSKYHNIYKIFFNMLYKKSKNKLFFDYANILDNKEYIADDLITEWNKLRDISQ